MGWRKCSGIRRSYLASRPDNITPHTDIMINNLTATQRAMLSPPRLPASWGVFNAGA